MRRSKAPRTETALPLIEMRPASAEGGAFELELSGGKRLRIPVTFEVEALERLHRRAREDGAIPGGLRIFVCTELVEMRRGFDRLAQTARERGDHAPVQGGAVFIFANRRATRLKLLWFERNGARVLYKRCIEDASSCR